MKLTQVSIRNFRSYVVGQREAPHILNVGDGLNLLLGPNNCGKSNLLRAIALALEDSGGSQFDASVDIPSQLSWAYPSITLTFHCDPRSSVEKTLLRYVEEYEKSGGATNPLAARRDVQLRVVYRSSGRDESFVVGGKPNAKGDAEHLQKALTQFKKAVRFIYLKSGESLSNFLSGAFNELLQTVLQEHLQDEVRAASKRREEYIEDLSQNLLKPLGEHALGQLQDVLSEIRGVTIQPFVPDLAETLSRATINITDVAETSILNKGTGVRGALLVALLGYLASHSRRSLILAVEEPESFLHPEAQRELAADLVDLARREDVTLLVTTHSPFVLDRSPSTLITPVSKDQGGISRLRDQVKGNERAVETISGLFGEIVTPSLLAQADNIRPGTHGILYVEGYTDKLYLESAAKLTGHEDLLRGFEIRYENGAFKSAIAAVLLQQVVGSELSIAALFDWDTEGRTARDLLKSRYRWSSSQVMTYREWMSKNPSETPVEAEDMFVDGFIEEFLRDNDEVVLQEKMKFADDTFHYGLSEVGKDELIRVLEARLKPRHCDRLVEILKEIRKRLKLDAGPTASPGGKPLTQASAAPAPARPVHEPKPVSASAHIAQAARVPQQERESAPSTAEPVAEAGPKRVELPKMEEGDERAFREIQAELKLADESGMGQEFRTVIRAGVKHGLYPRGYLTSVMLAPPANHNRFAIFVKPSSGRGGSMRLSYNPKCLEEFFGIDADAARESLGPEGRRVYPGDDLRPFVDALERLFASGNET